MLPAIANTSVSVSHPASVSSRGSTTRDWTNATTTTVNGCSLQPTDASSAVDTRYNTRVDATLWMPPSASIVAGDRVSITVGTATFTYEVQGRPMPMLSPTGALSHLKVNLVEWEG